MKKYFGIIMLLLSSCQSKVQSVSEILIDEFIFFRQSSTKLLQTYSNLSDGSEVEINKKSYLQKILKHKDKSETHFNIDKDTLEVVEVVKLKDRERAFYKNNIKNKFYLPKCFNKTTLIEFNLTNKEMILIKDNRIIFIAKSDLIEDRIKDDNSKICLNRWGH